MSEKIYVIDGISISPFDSEDKVRSIAKKKLRAVGISPEQYSLNIFKKSVDARKKDDIKLVYSVSAKSLDGSGDDAKFTTAGARAVELDSLEVRIGEEKMGARPIVVGMGPAGLFCALILAENGYKPLIIDRGDSISDRVASVNKF